MKCPFCDSEDTKVVDKRTSEDGINRRRRECLGCKKRFTTYERTEGVGEVKKIRKRNGKIVDFDPEKITHAIFAAAQAVGGKDKKKAEELTEVVVEKIKKEIQDEVPSVEQIQDFVEKVLIERGHAKTAKAYIIYRQKRNESREQRAFLSKITDVVDGYVNQADWRVRENSNAGYALSGLQAHISGAIIAEYALERTYPIEIADAHRNADFHIHDLSLGVFGGYSFYRNEVIVIRNKKTKDPLILSLEQLYNLVNAKTEVENDFEIKYSDEYEILDENGWTNIIRVLRHKTTKPLISLNTFNGNNLLVTNDHPFITLEDEKGIISCPECKSDNVIKNRANKTGKDYLKCKSCNYKFGIVKEDIPDIKKRKEIYAEDVKLNNFAISPHFKLECSNNQPVTAQDGWFIGMFIAEGYIKDKRLAFEMSDSPELRKLVNYLTTNNIDFNLNYSTFSGLQLLQKENTITISLNALSFVMQSLIMQIRPYSHNKNLPITMLNLSQEIVGSMISGVIDGDGVVRNDDKWVSRINLRMTSKALLSQMQFWLKSNNINSSLLTIDSYGEREYNNVKIKSKRQLYSLTTYIPDDKRYLFEECLKMDDKFKFSHIKPKFKSFSHFRKIEAIENDDEYVYDITTATHTFICNGILAHNCAGWSLRQLLQEGFNGVPGKVAAKPAKHFDAALGQIVNFFGTLQNEWAGAQAFSSFDTYLAPLIKIDNLSYGQVKQGMQEFIYGINQTSRWGNQVPFTNITMDWVVPEDLAKEDVLYGGDKMKEVKYKDCQKQMDMINRAFIEVMMEGDMDGRIFTFPIPTYNITKEFDWDSENAKILFEMTSKYGTPYFQNFINSSLKPGDVRSMCCRLQLNVKELRNKTGGLFGAGEQTGSIGVVTINLPKIGYLSKDKDEFFERLGRLMVLAKNSLEIKRKEVTKNMEIGLLPYSKRYLGNFRNHFSTIGLCGMNEACMNFLGNEHNITTPEGRKFALEVLDFMREELQEFQEETGHIYNLEATPAEGTSFRLAKHDKKRYPDIITAGEGDAPYYTNSSQLPVGYTNDVFEALDMQDEIQCKYTGGTVLHGFVGERISNWKTCAKLVKKVAYNYKLPYFTVTPTFSICPVHGYLVGEHHNCPHSHTEEELKKYGIEVEA